MKKILLTGLILSTIAGCNASVTVSPSPAPTSSPSPVISSSPSATPGPTTSPAVSSTPSPSATPFSLIGHLEGRLTVGPLCPVEPCNVTPDQKRQAYESRIIRIYAPNGETLIKEVTADYQTEMYHADLVAGKYIVKVSSPFPADPKEVTIIENMTTVLNLDVDTGIR
jgi:hypothetical protein